jgi:hypothetical protein
VAVGARGGSPAWLAAALVALLLGLSGCASLPAAGGAETPWQLPAGELAQQSLLRLGYRGAEGSASLKLVLRLRDESSYELAAADLFGRPVWALAADGGRAVWIDHRAGRWCRLHDAVRLTEFGLPELPLRAVPAFLLGRVPLPPGDRRTATPLDYRDGEGRRWTVALAGFEVSAWTLWEGDRPTLWFSARGGEMVLSSRRHEAQLRWRRTLREPLAAEAVSLAPPADFSEGGCDEPRLP